jgi:hypothetical protein
MAGNAEKATKKYLSSIIGGVTEFQRTQLYALMYAMTKELSYKVKHGIKSNGIEDYKDIIIVHDSKW